jgi:hypothetical protein
MFFECSIVEVFEVFTDQDPAVLYDIYCQVGRKKDLLIETILNGGVLPDHLNIGEEEEESEEEEEEDPD